MFEHTNIYEQLQREQLKRKTAGDGLVNEAHNILQRDLFSEEKILQHLTQYNDLAQALDEDAIEDSRVFSLEEIKHICINYRLKFLNSKTYKPLIPQESVWRIRELNQGFGKELKDFFILAPADSFVKKESEMEALLFTRTNTGNYYLIHQWGLAHKWYRKILFWPMRQFENLFITVALLTLIITLSLPTWLITLDHKADYWSGYRAAAFFHIFIFNMGVTAYITFAFAKNFSSTVWNREQDFG